MMPEDQRALRAVRRQIAAQPALLRRAGLGIDIAVQGDNVPGADARAVVALAGLTRRGAEIGVIGFSFRRHVFVIARHGQDARLQFAPGGLEAGGEIHVAAVGIDEVAQCHDRSRGLPEQFGGARRT